MSNAIKWALMVLAIGFFSSCTITSPDYYGQQGSAGRLFDPNNPFIGGGSDGSDDPSNFNNPNDPNNPFNKAGGSGNSNFGGGPPSGQPVTEAGLRELDFPYELIPDTLTALTCTVNQPVGGKPFTLHAGAYFAHGLQISKNFKESNDITSNTNPGPEKVRQLLEKSPFKEAFARLAIQNESNLTKIISSGGRPIQYPFPILHNNETLNHLSTLKPVFVTRSSSSSLVNRGGRFATVLPISGQMLHQFAEGLAAGTFGEPLLTLTYTRDGNSLIFSPNGKPFGRGYKLEFEDFYRPNYLIDISEENLLTAERDGDWVCPEELRFMVHRSTSKEQSQFNKYRNRFTLPEGLIDEGYCHTEGALPTKGHNAFFEMVFGRQLPFEFGYTAVSRQGGFTVTNQPCIKFRNQGCYHPGGGNTIYRIEFDPEKLDDCILIHQITDLNPGENDEYYKICPAFLSVCYRDSGG